MTVKNQQLGFRDGFDFGCGFFAAGFVFSIFAVPAGVVIFTVIFLLMGIR